MPEKFACNCGFTFFTNEVFQLNIKGEVLISRSDCFACLQCGRVYYAQNERVWLVEESEDEVKEEARENDALPNI